MPVIFSPANRQRVLSRQIRAFLRTWPGDQPKMAVGQEQNAHTAPKTDAFGKLRIKRVVRLTLESMTLQQAKMLGYPNVAAAVNGWKKSRASKKATASTTPLWLVEFDLIERK
jgi:hypothetical protein